MTSLARYRSIPFKTAPDTAASVARWTYARSRVSCASTGRRGPLPPTTSATSCTACPAAVLRPASTADVAETVRWAGRTGGTVAPQGRRHSVWGRAQTDGGVVVDMSALHTVHSVQKDRVVADAGATWRDVLAATLPHGRTPPVLTEHLDLSVGGTLAVGGIGGTSFGRGAQSDHVIELEVVTGAGDQVTCSAEREADLFDAARAGLGQVAVITRATLALVAAPRSVRRFLLSYRDLATMLRDARLLSGADRFDAVQGAVVPAPGGDWTFRLDVAAYVTGSAPDDAALLDGLSDDPARRQPIPSTYGDYAHRFDALVSALRDNGQWYHPHPWLTTFVGSGVAERVVGEELGRLTPAADLGPLGQVVVSPIRTAAFGGPMPRLPAGDLCFTLNLVRLPATGDAAAAGRLVAANRAAYERIRAAGGTLYPVSALPMSRSDWRDHLGPAYEGLAAARRTYDPAGVLTPGYEIF